MSDLNDLLAWAVLLILLWICRDSNSDNSDHPSAEITTDPGDWKSQIVRKP